MYLVGGWRVFDTLAEAESEAEKIRQATGAIVSVEEVLS